MKIFLVTAEHFSQPGFINKPFASMEGASVEAAGLINIMLKDTGLKANATPANWEKYLDCLQDYHGAAHCFVEISPADLAP